MGAALSVHTPPNCCTVRAVRAMDFDINAEWVSFMTYDSIRDPINPPATKLLPRVPVPSNGRHYFNTDERDFVAVYGRSPCTNS